MKLHKTALSTFSRISLCRISVYLPICASQWFKRQGLSPVSRAYLVSLSNINFFSIKFYPISLENFEIKINFVTAELDMNQT